MHMPWSEQQRYMRTPFDEGPPPRTEDAQFTSIIM